MQVLVTKISPGISITLVEGGDGWRFMTWSRLPGYKALDPPSVDAADKRFATSAKALEYFRTLLRSDAEA